VSGMRIVSLCPSLTELVFDLGRGEDLVGITTFCVHPADRVGAVEKVGGTKTPDVERIVELAPDIVLLNEEENRIEDAEALADAGVRCLASLPKDPATTAAMVREIAAALDGGEPGERTARATDIGERIARDIEERAARVARDAAGARRVRWAYLIWRKPWMSVNRDTFADALLRLPGGENVFADLTARYPEITLEDLRAARPDVVFLCSEPYRFDERHALELASSTGIERSRLRIVDGEYLSWHGSRTPDGIDYAERVVRAARALESRSASG